MKFNTEIISTSRFFQISFFVIALLFLLSPFFGRRAASHSMEPTLFPGDRVFTNVFDKSPSSGDIISFECINTSKCTGVVMHRFIRYDEKGCMHIQGDNSDAKAWDTRDYGCLMPYEVSIIGIDYPLKNFNPFK